MLQCRGRPYRRLHHVEHRAGADEVRGRGRHVPDGENAQNTETRHGTNRGKTHCNMHSHALTLFPESIAHNLLIAVSNAAFMV